MRERILGAYEALKKGAFIITTLIITFIAVRNSLKWHMEQFWGASQAFFYEKWHYIYKTSGENDFLMYTLGTQVIGVGTYVIANGFFMFVDLTGKPHQLHKYKIQENVNIPVRIINFSCSMT
jgi:methylsterol monooxygenase